MIFYFTWQSIVEKINKHKGNESKRYTFHAYSTFSNVWLVYDQLNACYTIGAWKAERFLMHVRSPTLLRMHI